MNYEVVLTKIKWAHRGPERLRYLVQGLDQDDAVRDALTSARRDHGEFLEVRVTVSFTLVIT